MSVCERCFASLRVYHVPSQQVSDALGVAPTGPLSKPRTVDHAWIFSTKSIVRSSELSEHLDWLFARLADRRDQLAALRAAGAAVDVFCYWVSKSGHGGPVISAENARALADHGLALGLDIYFAGHTA